MSDHSRSIKCLAAVIVILGSSLGFGQQNSGPTIVVVDVGRVFKEHIRFNTQMNAMKERVKAFDAVVRGKREQLQVMAQQAQDAGAESEKYKQLERQSAQAMSDLRVDLSLKKKEFMEEEARLYYDIYAEVTRAISEFADSNGIRMVLRYNSERSDSKDRNRVLQEINNNVVFQRNSDITKPIIDYCNRGSQRTANQGNREGPALPPLSPRGQ